VKSVLAMLAGLWLGAAAIGGHPARPAPAYVIAEVDVTDRATMQEYGRKVPETLAPFEGRYRTLVRGGKTWALEGERPKGIVVIAFDSADEALRWYESPAYAALRPIRKRAATSRIFLVEGVRP